MASAVGLLYWAIRFSESTTQPLSTARSTQVSHPAGRRRQSRHRQFLPRLLPARTQGRQQGRQAPGPGNRARSCSTAPAPRERSSPSPPATSGTPWPAPPPAAPPPPHRRPRQHPRAGASLGGAQLARAHHRGSPARRRGRDGGAGRCSRSAPSPLPAGWQGWRMLARCTPSLTSSAGSSACHPRLGYRSHHNPVLAPLAQAWIPKDKDPHSTAANLAIPNWAVGTQHWGDFTGSQKAKGSKTIVYFRNGVCDTFLVLGTRGLSRSLPCWKV